MVIAHATKLSSAIAVLFQNKATQGYNINMTNSNRTGIPTRRTSYWSGGVIAQEQGSVVKDWGWRLPVALVYPNRYYLGMSNLGCQVIYKMLNDRDDTVCERIFWEGKQGPLESIESARSLGDYSCAAFSFSYELDYLNLAPMFKSADIPLNPAERTDDHPILMAGGPAVTANPTPLSPIFDVLAIGEAEAILPAAVSIIAAGTHRSDTLRKLSSLPGLYVPSHHRGQPVKRQHLVSLDGSPAHSVVLTTDTELGELYLLEVERGCSWGCRFCLVSRAFCPTRFHTLDALLNQAKDGLKHRRRIGLVGPVVTDHPQIEELLSILHEMGAGFSLSSLRLKPLSTSLLRLVHQGGAGSIALAPEAGSERLRRLIGKGFNEDDILGAVERAAIFKKLKLYFILGLPTETDEDALGIAKLALQCKKLTDKVHISLNIAPFVPKAATPFERFGMAHPSTLTRRLGLISSNLRGSGIEVKSESPEWSQVQAALSRGDSRLAEVLSGIETNSLAGWRRAVKNTGLDIAHYVNNDWGEDATLPWAMVEM